MEVILMDTHVKQKRRMYYYLTFYCEFKKETLKLLNYKNLTRLAKDYGYKGMEE